MYTFENLEDFRKKLSLDNACSDGFEYVEEFETLEELILKCKKSLRIWCLQHGYIQFEYNCNWEDFTSNEWAVLLKNNCRYDDKCNFYKLESNAIKYLLRYRPDLLNKLNTGKLSKKDKKYVLKYKPELKGKI